MRRLEGKVALITGAARGIGLSFAEAYLREGARVVLADIDHDRAQQEARRLGVGALAVALDVTRQDSIDAAISEASEAFGPIDILINNAAIFTAAPIVEIERADTARVFDINVNGTLFMMQAVAKHMIANGRRGAIINMASQAGRRGEPLVAVYCASKAAVISLTQSAGLNLISHGINVNAIAPGVVDGEHWEGVDAFFAKHEGKAPGQKKREVGEAVPFGRMGTADDLTGMAIFLASDEAEYIVAQTYNVDGGNWMS
ncbi:L-iditol 2-dehydrogenase [Pontivivens insulae]|uniref:Sorbitol dehydrogenase n=1 Tax=Pontivivens insulae TaxID=1639689 RepID=A0A2R8AFT7_9RHOB|nr:L-iditol 2-dehydrogenase [Pontivivens insulae]RED12202.1 D-sorbitol dehydrogenase (acceptor) [Pontivivens insulae]SPF30958.1 Sorbitol dehydrogenase [Pontivivens insulae]